MVAALVAHGVHAALVLAGLVLVVGLLWRGRVRRRSAPDRAASEHERRVGELRDAARTGRLGLPPDDRGRHDA